MRIFIYSDESGVFDKKHNDIFVYGGLILLSKEQKEEAAQRYSHAEKTVREKLSFNPKKRSEGNNNPDKVSPSALQINEGVHQIWCCDSTKICA